MIPCHCLSNAVPICTIAGLNSRISAATSVYLSERVTRPNPTYALGDRFRKSVARHTLALLAGILGLRCSTDSTQYANRNVAGRGFVPDPACDRGLFDGLLVDTSVSADPGSRGAIPACSRYRFGVHGRRVVLRRLGPHTPGKILERPHHSEREPSCDSDRTLRFGPASDL